MVDIRYHLATIVGLFLALGLGMLIGMQLAEEGMLAEEQQRLAERIEEGLERMRAENRRLTQDVTQLREQLQAERQFVELTFGALFDGALSGQRLAVYGADMERPAVERLLAVLKSAGADVDVYQQPLPPEQDALTRPYVLVWSPAWGAPVNLGPWPSGGVVVSAEDDAAYVAAADGAATEYVVGVATPAGLLETIRRLSGLLVAAPDALGEGDSP